MRLEMRRVHHYRIGVVACRRQDGENPTEQTDPAAADEGVVEGSLAARRQTARRATSGRPG